MMMATVLSPASFSFAETADGQEGAASDVSDEAVLDGETVDGMTQDDLDEDSVLGSDIDEFPEISESGDEGDMSLFATSKGWSKKSEGVWYNGNATGTLTGAVAKGIDVSSWQGKINWSKVKADGIDFVIIRLGYGSDYKSQDDAKLAENIKGCEENGIPYGFYLYSYANTAAKNNGEIQHVLRLLKGTHPTYPVYYDLEDKNTTGKCSNASIREWGLNFCKQIKAAGYTPGIYASLTWWNSKLYTSQLDSYERWVAQWNYSGCTYGRGWKLWQCADNYYVSGISGRVDLNFSYKKFTAAKTPAATDKSEKVTGWVTKNGKKYYYNSSGNLVKSKWFTVSGKKYYATSSGAIYKGVYKKIGNYYYGFSSAGVMYAGKTAKIDGKKYYFNKKGKAYLCKAKTTARLYKRSGPGTNYSSKGLYKKGAKVNIIRKSGDWWYTSGGVWISKKYVKVTKKYPY